MKMEEKVVIQSHEDYKRKENKKIFDGLKERENNEK